MNNKYSIFCLRDQKCPLFFQEGFKYVASRRYYRDVVNQLTILKVKVPEVGSREKKLADKYIKFILICIFTRKLLSRSSAVRKEQFNIIMCMFCYAKVVLVYFLRKLRHIRPRHIVTVTHIIIRQAQKIKGQRFPSMLNCKILNGV